MKRFSVSIGTEPEEARVFVFSLLTVVVGIAIGHEFPADGTALVVELTPLSDSRLAFHLFRTVPGFSLRK
jgi:hypothetical protein